VHACRGGAEQNTGIRDGSTIEIRVQQGTHLRTDGKESFVSADGAEIVTQNQRDARIKGIWNQDHGAPHAHA
jgi:hypothetical protein